MNVLLIRPISAGGVLAETVTMSTEDISRNIRMCRIWPYDMTHGEHIRTAMPVYICFNTFVYDDMCRIYGRKS